MMVTTTEGPELGIMVQEGIFLAHCTNINGGACHLDRTQKIFIGSLDAVCPSYTTKKIFWPPWRSLRLVRPPRPKIFQKTSMAQNA